MGQDRFEEKERQINVREFLQFWARELLAMQDEAKKLHKVNEYSEKEDVLLKLRLVSFHLW